MEYNGYTANVEFDDEAGVFHGQVLDLRDVITFEATSVEGLRAEFRASVDDYLSWCEERGEEPDRPFSGRFVVRLDPQMHRAASVCAGRTDVSLNDWMIGAVEAALDHEWERDRGASTKSRLRTDVAEGLEQARRGELTPGEDVRERIRRKSRQRRT